MKKVLFILLLSSLFSCSENTDKADGYGNFEATEVTISSESNGKIQYLNLKEGDVLQALTQVGLVDTIQLYYTKQQLIASKQTIYSRSGVILSQKAVLSEQLKSTQIETNRIHNMYKENAATKRQVDEIDGKMNVIVEQIKSIGAQNAPIINDAKAIDFQIEKINDQLLKSKITNPIKGTVLGKYAEPNEITSIGKPLYKIADLSLMTLRVYISEIQLSSIRVGQVVMIKIDGEKEMKSYKGQVSWIASFAEFTPKVIQTKEERVNLVYAVKITVQNDGGLRIGMPAEMWIKKEVK